VPEVRSVVVGGNCVEVGAVPPLPFAGGEFVRRGEDDWCPVALSIEMAGGGSESPSNGCGSQTE
jgi:hypothetical protein